MASEWFSLSKQVLYVIYHQHVLVILFFLSMWGHFVKIFSGQTIGRVLSKMFPTVVLQC